MGGCDMGCGGCDSPCGKKRCGGLLKKLFGNLTKKSCGCDSAPACDTCGGGCGCGSATYSAPMAPAPVPAPAPAAPATEAAPMPPAPIVDPSASISQKRRVIQASARYVR
ncbi:MAG: hypothetical protein AAFV88_19630 [Planctomycetota bacterium]